VDTRSAALSTDAAALLAEYYHYADLAEHVRALPEAAAAVLGYQNAAAEPDGILAELEAQILTRLERLDALGLYPTTTTAVDVTVNGVPIALPDLCRESTTNALPDAGSPTKEDCMHTAIEQSEHHDQHNGLDRALDTPGNGPGFFAAYVRPYLGYAATFAAGAVCGVIGAHYFAGESTELSA
jgi:hypothetical protein